MSQDRDDKAGGAFKVTDRRQFTVEGDARAGAPPPTQAEPTPVLPAPAPASQRPTPAQARPAAQSGPPSARPPVARPPSARPASPHAHAPSPDEPERRAQHHGEAPPEDDAIDFPQFVMSIARLAAMFLGDIPSPQSGRPELNLAAAKQQIDLLAMLQKKTRGNCSRDEDQLLQTLLTELRLRFVEIRDEVAALSAGGGAKKHP